MSSDPSLPGQALQALAQPTRELRRAALDRLEARQRELASRPALPSGNPVEGLSRPEVQGWSWAAFLGGPAWALAHGMAALALLLLFAFWLFPLVNVVLGLTGGSLAWRRRRFRSMRSFRRVQRAWALGGVWLLALQLGMIGALGWFILGLG